MLDYALFYLKKQLPFMKSTVQPCKPAHISKRSAQTFREKQMPDALYTLTIKRHEAFQNLT